MFAGHAEWAVVIIARIRVAFRAAILSTCKDWNVFPEFFYFLFNYNLIFLI